MAMNQLPQNLKAAWAAIYSGPAFDNFQARKWQPAGPGLLGKPAKKALTQPQEPPNSWATPKFLAYSTHCLYTAHSMGTPGVELASPQKKQWTPVHFRFMDMTFSATV